MTDKPTPPVSVRKSGTRPGASAGKAPDGAKAGKPSPPRYVVLAAGAMVLSGVFGLAGALSLFGYKGWLFREAVKTNNKAKPKDKKTLAELHHQIDKTVPSLSIQAAVVLVAICVVAFAVYRGRHWGRWAVLGLWVLCTFTQQFAGFTSVLSITTSEPVGFKLPIFASGALLIVAVVLTSLRPSVTYFNLGRPERPAGAPQRRGLFAPRQPAPARRPGGRAAAGGATAKPAASAERADNQPDRSRAKQRINAEAVAKGAEAARARAKASKSRRTGV